MHNWADEHAKIILKHLRDVAKVNEGVKLVIVDGLLKNACRAAVSESSVLTDGYTSIRKKRSLPCLSSRIGVPRMGWLISSTSR